MILNASSTHRLFSLLNRLDMCYSMLRRLFPIKGGSGRISAGAFRYLTNSGFGGGTEMSKFRASPWLLLPPARGSSGDILYNFYSVAEDRVVSLGGRLPFENGVRLVGSSHGWVALFNERNNDLFITNPLSGRRIKLPPIDTLPDPDINLRDGCGSVSKVVLSSSPDDGDDECRAMMTFGPGDRLAFCSPGHSSSTWTPIGDLFFRTKFDNPHMSYARGYEDFVYCRTKKSFACITQFELDLFWAKPQILSCLEYWDLREPDAPMGKSISSWGNRRVHPWPMKETSINMRRLEMSVQIPYLVLGMNDQLFLVIRFVLERVGERVPYDRPNTDVMYPYKTIGFLVFKVDNEDGLVNKLRMVEEGSLDGLAMFVGNNESFAVEASAFPELRSNSIYFTDANKNFTPGYHDLGVFDYENRRLSPLYCPSQLISGPPLWFNPNAVSL